MFSIHCATHSKRAAQRRAERLKERREKAKAAAALAATGAVSLEHGNENVEISPPLEKITPEMIDRANNNNVGIGGVPNEPMSPLVPQAPGTLRSRFQHFMRSVSNQENPTPGCASALVLPDKKLIAENGNMKNNHEGINGEDKNSIQFTEKINGNLFETNKNNLTNMGKYFTHDDKKNCMEDLTRSFSMANPDQSTDSLFSGNGSDQNRAINKLNRSQSLMTPPPRGPGNGENFSFLNSVKTFFKA